MPLKMTDWAKRPKARFEPDFPGLRQAVKAARHIRNPLPNSCGVGF